MVESGGLVGDFDAHDRLHILAQLGDMQGLAVPPFQAAVLIGRKQHQAVAAVVGDGDGFPDCRFPVAAKILLEFGRRDADLWPFICGLSGISEFSQVGLARLCGAG